jgi:hypothetical protein
VLVDFSPVYLAELTLLEFSQRFTIADLRAASDASLDTILNIIGGADDAQIVHIPYDPDANDPLAPPEEQHDGWNLAHLVVHVTASSEEWAAVSSILARGIVYPREPRLRCETHWKTLTTRAQVLQRIEESRRMRLAYLDTWPDRPQLDVFRDMSERFTERHGRINATAAFLYGLRHEIGHHDQFRDAARQAREAVERIGG